MFRKFVTVCAVLVALSSEVASAQSLAPPNVTRSLGLMGFVLGKSTLGDAEATMGKSPARKCSRDEEASNEVCYVSAGRDRTKVVFEAGSSGGWKVLDGYKVMARSVTRRCYSRCSRTAKVTSGVQADSGLKLGLTREQVVSLLGRPKRLGGNTLSFEWQTRRAMTKEEIEAAGKTFKSRVAYPYFDVDDTIDVTLADSKVVQFEVHHTVTD